MADSGAYVASPVLDESKQGTFCREPGLHLAELYAGSPVTVFPALPALPLPALLSRYAQLCLVGPLEALELDGFCRDALAQFPREALSGPAGAIQTSFLPDADGALKRVAVLVPAADGSRHNAPGRPDSVSGLLRGSPLVRSGQSCCFLLMPAAPDQRASTAMAIGRCFPGYTRKTGVGSTAQDVDIFFVEPIEPAAALTLNRLLFGSRAAAAMVDAPAAELTTEKFVNIARELASMLAEPGADYEPPVGHAISCSVTTGDALNSAQPAFGGIYGVGKAGMHPPSLVVLGAASSLIERTVVLVGKGIVFDTGGLQIKTKEGMPGMKTDMGGAAAILHAFTAAVMEDLPTQRNFNLYAILCVAENAIGPHAVRPDDILTMYSGKTVEINNTDAEGRLVLADGVAYASLDLKADVVIDMATLTGAQGVATGQRHAAVVTNSEALEQIAVAAGQQSGELVHPLPYCPEFFMPEFKSEVADMKNSVKRRNNAQVSCAAHFIEQHLHAGWKGEWLHIDMASPATEAERATGYGVGLLKSILDRL